MKTRLISFCRGECAAAMVTVSVDLRKGYGEIFAGFVCVGNVSFEALKSSVLIYEE